MSRKFIDLIEAGNFLDAQKELNEILTDRAADFLLEKKKEVVVKMFPSGVQKGKEEKKDLNETRRKNLKAKLAKLKKGK